jgi:F420-dependent oxidoreductase-like protein
MALRLGIELPYTEMHDRASMVELAHATESAGFDSLWISELYSFDAFTTLTHLALETSRIKVGTNIANIYARTPAMLASTAASLDQLSGGRLILGIGVSGPQVIEGWHGVPYDKPLQRTRETIDIVRKVLAGERLTYAGEVFNVQQGLRLMNKALRPDVPIYVAAIGPKNVEMTAEIADGWLPTFFSTSHADRVFKPHVEAGLAKAGRDPSTFEVMPFASAFAGDVQTGIDICRFIVGFYIGGMGSKKKNFYNQLVRRYGYEAEAEKIQDLFLSGDRNAAIAAVPDDLIDDVSIIGDESRMRDRLKAFEAAGATGVVIGPMAPGIEDRRHLIDTLAKANS